MVDDLKPPIGINSTSGGPVADVLGHGQGDQAAVDLGPRRLLGGLVPVVPPGQGGDGGQLDVPLQLLVISGHGQCLGRVHVGRLVEGHQTSQPPVCRGHKGSDPPLYPHGDLVGGGGRNSAF